MQTVKIGGEERPVKFGFNTLAEFGRKTGITLSGLQKLGDTLTIANVITLIWCGLKEGARKEGIPFDVDEVTVGDWLDEDPNLVAEMMEHYGDSQAPVSNGKKKPEPKKK